MRGSENLDWKPGETTKTLSVHVIGDITNKA
jgi:hypothetical protein